MKQMFTLFFALVFFSLPLSADIFQGYIVTKTGLCLTGQIGTIAHNDFGSSVVFINDFGSIYDLHPALISGFVYNNGKDTYIYESKYHDKNWLFLRKIEEGSALKLYRAPEEKMRYISTGFEAKVATYKNDELWLEFKGKNLYKIKRMGFKKQLTKLFKKNAPHLCDKIGSPGYKYKDLQNIVKEYNEEYKEGRKSL